MFYAADPSRERGALDLLFRVPKLSLWSPENIAALFGIEVPRREAKRESLRIRYTFPSLWTQWQQVRLLWCGIDSDVVLVGKYTRATIQKELDEWCEHFGAVRREDLYTPSYVTDGLELSLYSDHLSLHQQQWNSRAEKSARCEVRTDGLWVNGRWLRFGSRVRLRTVCGTFKPEDTGAKAPVFADMDHYATLVDYLTPQQPRVYDSCEEQSFVVKIKLEPAMWESDDGSMVELGAFQTSCHSCYLDPAGDDSSAQHP